MQDTQNHHLQAIDCRQHFTNITETLLTEDQCTCTEPLIKEEPSEATAP